MEATGILQHLHVFVEQSPFNSTFFNTIIPYKTKQNFNVYMQKINKTEIQFPFSVNILYLNQARARKYVVHVEFHNKGCLKINAMRDLYRESFSKDKGYDK